MLTKKVEKALNDQLREELQSAYVYLGMSAYCESESLPGFAHWLRTQWQEELERSPHDYRLFKAEAAGWLERYHVQRCLRYVFGAVLVSASVQLVLLPLMIVYFHRLSLASLLLNIVVSVLLAVLVGVALLALLISQVSATLSTPLFKLANVIDWLMVHSIDPFSELGLASIRLPEYSGPAALLYALYYLPLLVLVIALSHWRPLASRSERECRLHRFIIPATAVQMLLLAILIFHPLSSGRADGNLRVDFLDVGQGDSALVTLPDGTTLLVDSGGRLPFPGTSDSARRIGETVVSEYLWWRGLSEIDYVVATHADADHIEGFSDVLRNFSVKAALVGPQTSLETRTHVERMHAGDVMRFGDVDNGLRHLDVGARRGGSGARLSGRAPLRRPRRPRPRRRPCPAASTRAAHRRRAGASSA